MKVLDLDGIGFLSESCDCEFILNDFEGAHIKNTEKISSAKINVSLARFEPAFISEKCIFFIIKESYLLAESFNVEVFIYKPAKQQNSTKTYDLSPIKVPCLYELFVIFSPQPTLSHCSQSLDIRPDI
jgi:hypothetical protein